MKIQEANLGRLPNVYMRLQRVSKASTTKINSSQ